jgi:SAM-dependent methyltransferase
MNKAYWNNIGSAYNGEIFDAYKEDRTGKLKKYLRKYAHKDHFAIDVGCGTGKALPYLSPAFKKILAVDISSELLRQAEALGYPNVSFKKADLAKVAKMGPADFAFCCNVAILPDVKKDKGIIKNVERALKRGGAAVFVLPSFESVFFSASRLIAQYERDGIPFGKIPKSELDYFNVSRKDLLQGLIKISGVKTKHYSHPELELLFDEVGLSVKKIERLEYDWDTEFASPPKWLQAPYPWDWIVECGKP